MGICIFSTAIKAETVERQDHQGKGTQLSKASAFQAISGEKLVSLFG
jgi:hypothetical protein